MPYRALIRRLRACVFTVIDPELALIAANFIEAQQAAMAGQAQYVETLERKLAAMEVVHGYNIDWDTPSLFECSVCHWSCNDTYYGDTADYNYCPNCGAKMDGQREG